MSEIQRAVSGDYPRSWRTESGYDPNQDMLQLKGRDYLTVQSRLVWFIHDQRTLIMNGLATTSYALQTELVEIDRERGWAHFKTYVRDVLGNEATMYGSEAAKDFPDFAEKASTKSLGRALLALGYGTASAQEMDEGERVGDTPQERRSGNAQTRSQQTPRPPTPTHQQPSKPPAQPTPTPAQPTQAQPTQAQPTQAQPTPAQRASDDLSAQKVPASQQRDLCMRIKEAFGYTKWPEMDAWLSDRIKSRTADSPRGVIGAEALYSGTADIDMAEQSLILSMLTAQQKVSGGGRH